MSAQPIFLLFFVTISLFHFVALPTAFCGTPELLFDAGSRAYLDGDWAGALDYWKQIETSGYQAGELFYNMGNAYFKLSEPGEAILYWEKADRLMGENSDLSANLAIARARLVDKLDEPVRLPIWNKFDRLRAAFPRDTLALGGTVFCFLVFATLGIRKWAWRGFAARRRLTRLVWALVVVLAVDLSLLALDVRDDLTRREGVLTETEVQVLSAPAEETGKLLFSLHEGTKVRVLRELEGWFEISAGTDRQGWVKRGTIGII